MSGVMRMLEGFGLIVVECHFKQVRCKRNKQYVGGHVSDGTIDGKGKTLAREGGFKTGD